MTAYQLDNAEDRNRKHPQFEIPERNERDNLRPGDLVKLIFLADALHGERTWVEVEGRADTGSYIGRMDDDAVLFDLKRGDVVRFGPEHVIDIWSEAEATP